MIFRHEWRCWYDFSVETNLVRAHVDSLLCRQANNKKNMRNYGLKITGFAGLPFCTVYVFLLMDEINGLKINKQFTIIHNVHMQYILFKYLNSKDIDTLYFECTVWLVYRSSHKITSIHTRTHTHTQYK